MTTTSKVAIIGTGAIGTALATNFVKGNRPIIIADRTLQKAATLSTSLGPLAIAASIEEAIHSSDIIIFAVWFAAIKELLQKHQTILQGKTIVDPSNPIAPDENGGFKKIIEENSSAGQEIARLLPAGAKLVKALGTLGVASLSNAAFQKPQAAVLFYAADDDSIKPVIEELIHDQGFESYYVGGINESIRIEVFGELHEFGALGKTVTLSEIKN